MITFSISTTNINAAHTQEELQTLFDTEAERIINNPIIHAELTEIPYLNSPHFAGLANMFEITNDTKYLDWELDLIEESLGKMIDIDGDGKLEWEDKINQSPMDHDNNPNTPPRYTCLYTQRGAREMMRLARIIKNDSCLSQEYQQRADTIIRAVKKDIINDPYCKERFRPDYKWVNHIVSHPATILLELYLIEGNVTYLEGEPYKTLDTVTALATSMKSAHFPQENGSVLWGNIGCDALRTEYPACYYLELGGHPPCGDYNGSNFCNVSDVSHSDNYISTINQLYRSNVVMTKEDIDAVTKTFLLNIWDQSLTDPKFKDFTDGRLAPDDMPYPYLPWVMGRNISPGWISLGAWSEELQNVAQSIDLQKIPRSGQFYKLAYFSQLAKNMKVKECKFTNQAREISDGIDNDCDGYIDENQSCLAERIEGDLDGNNLVNIFDYSILLTNYGMTNCQYNLVGDCHIDIFDYNQMVQAINNSRL